MKTAIFTSAVEQEHFNLVLPSFIEYSKKIKADLIIRQSQHLQNFNIRLIATFERYDIYNLLKIYDRVLWLDSDIYITKNAKNIFDIVPDNKLGVYIELNSYEKECVINRMVETMKLTSPVTNYFNSGVILASKQHAELFNMSKANDFFSQSHIKICENSDQDYLNLMAKENNTEFFSLPSNFNHMIKWLKFDNKNIPDFIHFAGCQPKKIFLQQFLKANPNL